MDGHKLGGIGIGAVDGKPAVLVSLSSKLTPPPAAAEISKDVCKVLLTNGIDHSSARVEIERNSQFIQFNCSTFK